MFVNIHFFIDINITKPKLVLMKSKIIILTPVYKDWQNLDVLLE
jgi:hypothetical protein